MAVNASNKASAIWYVLGFFGVGYLIGLIYMLVSESKDRVLSLLYLLGFIGAIIIYVIERDKDPKFADLSLKLLIGSIAGTVIFVVLFVGISLLRL